MFNPIGESTEIPALLDYAVTVTGGTADWTAKTEAVILNINGKTINMQIGVVLGKYGVAPIIIDNRTYVPIRFVAEKLGADVEWPEKEQTVIITKNLVEK